MLIKTNASGFNHALSSDLTSLAAYQGRRDMIKRMATGVAGAAIAGWAGREAFAQTVAKPGKLASLAGGRSAVAGAVTMEKVTDYKDVTSYNNFYEFGTDKADPGKNAHTLVTKPWSVAVEGLVKNPKTYTLEDLIKLSPQDHKIGLSIRALKSADFRADWETYSENEGTGTATLGDHFRNR